MSDQLQEPVLLGPLLGRLADESNELAALTERAEEALHAMLDGRAGLPPGVGQDLQRIDLVRQSLQDMARLLSSAALQVPKESVLPAEDLYSSLRLMSFASRLTENRLSTTEPLASDSGQDELGLF